MWHDVTRYCQSEYEILHHLRKNYVWGFGDNELLIVKKQLSFKNTILILALKNIDKENETWRNMSHHRFLILSCLCHAPKNDFSKMRIYFYGIHLAKSVGRKKISFRGYFLQGLKEKIILTWKKHSVSSTVVSAIMGLLRQILMKKNMFSITDIINKIWVLVLSPENFLKSMKWLTFSKNGRC